MGSEPLPTTDAELLKLKLANANGGVARISNVLFVTPKGEAAHFNGGTLDLTTGIQGIAYATHGERVLDMSGRKVNVGREHLSKGVYVINNKKVVIK